MLKTSPVSTSRRTLVKAALIAPLAPLASLAPMLAHADGPYPGQTVKLVVPFPAGGNTDIIARILAKTMAEDLRQPVVIDNKAGAGGNIGVDMVAKAAPDGYTLLMGYVGPLAINPSLYRKMPYDTLRDFAPVTAIASSTLVLAAHPSTNLKSVKELVARAKTAPLGFASAGSGTPAHLAGELINAMAGIKMQHVPYKGAAPVVTELLGNQVPLGIAAMPAVIQHVKAGRLNALGVSSPQRSIFAPDVPTISESGLPGYEVENWQGLLVPTGTPQAIINKLHGETVRILQTVDAKERLYNQGFEVGTNTPQQFAAYLKVDIQKWAKLVKSSGASVD